MLLPFAGPIAEADARLAAAAADAVAAAIEAVPGEWLEGGADARAEIATFFSERLADRSPWLEEAERARA